MNINKLIDRISNNWAAKVICLILAFLSLLRKLLKLRLSLL